MNLTRLMVLGLLDANGPMHGYRVRAIAERSQAEGWGGVSLGSLNRELRMMGDSGLVDPVRSESVANRPVRTVYQITDAGRQTLRELREEAISQPSEGPDRLGVALLFGRIGDWPELRKLLEARRAAIAGQLAYTRDERERLVSEKLITLFDAAMFRRQEMRMEAELRWLDEYGLRFGSMPGSDPGESRDDDAEPEPPESGKKE
jgi:DNA-binding PadR family transcriptional regulator